ncbi:MAG: AAA family ATPase [Tannerella sp.]|nr:AAA family ATPase [Tannerella sp.]
MEIHIPERSLVALIGTSGSGKSTFARRHFKPTETVSSDTCRAWVSDDENNQAATNDAFEVLYHIAGKRLRNGLLTVVDATNVQAFSRRHIVDLARRHHCLPVAIVFDLPEEVCCARNLDRSDRVISNRRIHAQWLNLKQSLCRLKDEGFRQVHVLKSVEEVEAVTGIVRVSSETAR